MCGVKPHEELGAALRGQTYEGVDQESSGNNKLD